MNDNAKRWIAALRSGEYAQGKGYLRTHDDTFCCLGVLCDVVDPSKWKEFDIKTHTYARSYESARTWALPTADVFHEAGMEHYVARVDWARVNAVLPRLAQKLKDEDLIHHNGEASLSLPVLNDKFDATFEEIATLLETFPEKFFTNHDK